MTRKAIRDTLTQALVAANLSYPIKWPNAPFNTPNNAVHLRMTLISIGDEPRTLGAQGRNQNDGVLQVDVFAPKNSGDIALYNAVDDVLGVYSSGKDLSYNGRVIRINSVTDRQGTDDSSWFHRIIEVNFTTFTNRGT